MIELVLQLVVAPALVGVATLAARRWGHRTGGLVSAFPAIVGPVLAIDALRHGTAFAAEAATGTLLGLVALSAFAVAYGRIAPRAGWVLSLAGAWVVAAAVAAPVGSAGATLPIALAAACASLVLAYLALPGTGAEPPVLAVPSWDLPLRMALTALLVVALAAAADRFGAVAGGLLAALPVLACILAAFTHRHHGAAAVASLLRGMLAGMAGFVVFCALIAAVVEDAGIAPAFAAATLAAVAVQLVAARR